MRLCPPVSSWEVDAGAGDVQDGCMDGGSRRGPASLNAPPLALVVTGLAFALVTGVVITVPFDALLLALLVASFTS